MTEVEQDMLAVLRARVEEKRVLKRHVREIVEGRPLDASGEDDEEREPPRPAA
jgi:hypothetical protein